MLREPIYLVLSFVIGHDGSGMDGREGSIRPNRLVQLRFQHRRTTPTPRPGVPKTPRHWSPTQEIRWSPTQEIEWASTEEILHLIHDQVLVGDLWDSVLPYRAQS